MKQCDGFTVRRGNGFMVAGCMLKVEGYKLNVEKNHFVILSFNLQPVTFNIIRLQVAGYRLNVEKRPFCNLS